jgi:glycosyltransferase involved in cell wall biosynthesis
VVAHFLLPCLFPIASAARCPVTAVAHGSDVALFARLPRVARHALAAHFVSRDVRIRFVAERLQGELLAAAGPHGAALTARSQVAPCPIDVDGAPDRATARRTLGLDEGFLAVSLSRLVPGKRLDWALSRAPVPPGAHWVVLGDGPELSRLRRAHPEVRFLGRVDRPTALTWLAAADVLVACSEREGAPTAIREARLLGTEVWTNAVGDVSVWAEKDPGIRVLAGLEPKTR